MAWVNKPKKPGSVPCNGQLVRFLRDKQGITQEKLARLAGCSRRLIAKVEAGDSVHADTIETIAEALSTPDSKVHPDDLSCDQKALVLAFLKNYAEHERHLVAKCKHFLADDMTTFSPGDPSVIPFAGEHHGIEGFDRFWQLFFDLFNRPNKTIAKTPLKMREEGNHVIALIKEQVELPDTPIDPPSFVTLHFEFEKGKIKRFEDYFEVSNCESILRSSDESDQTS